MSRGKQLKTKIKEAVRTGALEAESIRIGSLKAERKFEQNKPLMLSLKEKLSNMIDRVDPIEVLALGASTFLIHTAILASESVVHDLELKLKSKEGLDFFVGMVNPFVPLYTSAFQELGLNPLNPLVKTQSISAEAGLKAQAPQDAKLASSQKAWEPGDSIEIWLLSFVLAFLMIRWGADLIKSGTSGVLGLIPLLGL